MAAEFDENIVRGCETDEGMIHDDQIVAIEILLDRRFAELAQRSPVPVDAKPGMKCLVLGCTLYQRGVTSRMIPGKSF